jgi:2-polyprenyl-6-methoxyphenol hydroxylase-like FAD-dependent oxidoreductase
MDRWANGRLALAGDAASSVSLFGDRSTLAITGGHTLAEELTAPRPPPAGVRPVPSQAPHAPRPQARGHQDCRPADRPATRTGIAARHLASRLWPAAAATGWVRNHITPPREPSRGTT